MKPVRLFGMILAGALLTSGVVYAQGFPNKPIRLVVPLHQVVVLTLLLARLLSL